MTRGNQRDKDRERALKKTKANAKKPKQSAEKLRSKQESDANIMREKQKKALEVKEGEASSSTKK